MQVSAHPEVKIVNPKEGQSLEALSVIVVASGPLVGNETCALLQQHTATGPKSISRDDLLAVATLQQANSSHFFACLPTSHAPAGTYCILLISAEEMIVASLSVVLARSKVTEFRFLPISSRVPYPVWPLEFVHSQVSTFAAPGRKSKPVFVEEVEPSDLLNKTLSADEPIAAVLERPEGFDANGTVLHDLCLGAELPAYKALQAGMIWNSPYSYLARFDNAIADVREGVVLYGGNQIWGDSTIAAFAANPDISRFDRWFEIGTDMGWLEQYTELEPLERPVMLFCHWASQRNHAHWLMNSLISIYQVLPQLQSGSLFLLCHRLAHQHRTTLLKLGVPGTAILETDDPFVRCKTLIFPSPLSTAANICPSAGLHGYFETLKGRFGIRLAKEAPERVYFTRRGFPSGRTILNEDELLEKLHERGFVCIAPHELSLEEEIYVVSRAKVIVGQIGAALTNLGFAPPGAVIVELGTDNYTSNEYCRMATILGHKYVRIMVKPDQKAFVSDHQFNFTVPIPAISKVLEQL